jgi:4-azaleucine resistance transporter AzlC
MWTSPLPVMMLIVSTFIINIRYVLMSASLYPYASDAKGWQSYFSVFFMIDESWALALSEMPKGSVTITFLLGSGFANYLFWISSTMIGRTMGSFMPSPEAIGIDFVFTALFLTIIASGFKGKKDMPVILSALGAALIAEHYLGGKWYILIGGLVGSFAGWQTYEHK